jgi:hypothetical protein
MLNQVTDACAAHGSKSSADYVDKTPKYCTHQPGSISGSGLRSCVDAAEGSTSAASISSRACSVKVVRVITVAMLYAGCNPCGVSGAPLADASEPAPNENG